MANTEIIYEAEAFESILKSLNGHLVTVVNLSGRQSQMQIKGKIARSPFPFIKEDHVEDEDHNWEKDEDGNYVYETTEIPMYLVIGKDGEVSFPLHKVSEINPVRKIIMVNFGY